MFITLGSVRDQVKLEELQAKWRLKKQSPQSIGLAQPRERETEVVIGEHRMPKHDYKRSEIETRLNCGKPLSSSEMEYLRANYPEAYARACRVKTEREAYERELRRCRSKDDVRFLRMSRTASFAGDIRTSSKSAGAVGETYQKSMADTDEHNKFLRSRIYSRLPENRRGRRTRIILTEMVIYDKNAKKQKRIGK